SPATKAKKPMVSIRRTVGHQGCFLSEKTRLRLISDWRSRCPEGRPPGGCAAAPARAAKRADAPETIRPRTDSDAGSETPAPLPLAATHPGPAASTSRYAGSRPGSGAPAVHANAP